MDGDRLQPNLELERSHCGDTEGSAKQTTAKSSSVGRSVLKGLSDRSQQSNLVETMVRFADEQAIPAG
jgi:hypothetical protein